MLFIKWINFFSPEYTDGTEIINLQSIFESVYNAELVVSSARKNKYGIGDPIIELNCRSTVMFQCILENIIIIR